MRAPAGASIRVAPVGKDPVADEQVYQVVRLINIFEPEVGQTIGKSDLVRLRNNGVKVEVSPYAKGK